MKAFYGSKISPNMTVTPDGFLICHNVPLARTGWYEYLGEEIGIKGKEGQIVKVYRSPEEVFSKAAIASFEGKPVTDNHPPELLTPNDATIYTKGTTQNVHQSQDETDLLVGDLIIYDANLIKEIQDGKREISCGYDLVYIDNDDGTYSQSQICGNHVAVVNAGRAGDRIAIKDSKINDMRGEQKNMSKKVKIPQKRGPISNFLTAFGFKHYAADAEPEEIANTLDELIEERNCGEDEEPEASQKSNLEPKEESKDAETNPQIEALTQQVAKLTEIVSKLVKPQGKTPEQEIDEAIKSLKDDAECNGDITDEENSVTIPAEEISNDEDIPDGVVVDPQDRPENPIPGMDSIAKIMVLKAIKPIIANISNPEEKKKACDEALKVFRSAKSSKSNINGYSQIIKNQRNSAATRQKAADEKQREIEQIGENYKKKFNPHYKEVK